MAGVRGKLARYRAKREFDITPEPSGGAATQGGNSFVVQKHAARRLHYDFRLEMDGVLKSWAVPKGPSVDPADRRLAAHVEDHPVDYGGFEGTIPKGQYGGGTVMLWDRGTWEPQPGENPEAGYRKGRLKFILHGARMKGGWTLVRMGKSGQERNSDNWLLIKERDAYAQPGAGNALVDEGLTSVASGHSMEEIAADGDGRVWHSNRGKDDADPEAPRKTRGKAAPANRGTAKLLAGIAKLPGARRGALPDFVPPSLASAADHPPTGSGWLHEIKIDGYRIFARRRAGKVALLTRTGLDWTTRFQPIAAAVARLPGGDLALDGEVAVIDAKGGSSFAALQDALSRGDGKPLRYVVFDLLYCDGYDLRGARLSDRKEALRGLLAGTPDPLAYSDHIEGPGQAIFAQAQELKLEGIVSKRADKPYREGRNRDWIKAKCVARQEFVIVGYVDSKAHRGVGSLALGYYDNGALRYAGRVGSGFEIKQAGDLAKRLKPLITTKMQFPDLPAAARRGVHWIEPKLVCEVEFLNWTADDVLRHATFLGLREDKPPEDVTREPVAPAIADDPAPPAAPTPSRKRNTKIKTTAAAPANDPPDPPRKTAAAVIAGVTISHPDRMVFPDLGTTKRDLVAYYEAVGEWIMPHIANRPLSLLRCPSGIADCFFQKHFETGLKTLNRVSIKESGRAREYVVLRDVKDLVALIQEGIVEIHPWGATADDPDKPDQIIFDFDPAPELGFDAVISAAGTMRDYLDAMGLQSFLKTTGGKGLHVAAPIRRDASWQEVKEFTRKIAANLAAAAPDRFTINPLKGERTGRIFVDYLRNARGSTAVAPYCVRARPGAFVALPLAWEELTSALDPKRYTIATVPKLLAGRRRDPWAGMLVHRQSIGAARRALGLAA